MSAIFGLYGIFDGNLSVSALKMLRHRGGDSAGIFLLSAEKMIFKNNLIMSSHKEDELNNIFNFDYSDNKFNIGLAYNHLSISKKLDNNEFDCNNLNHYHSNGNNYSYKIFKVSNSLKNQKSDLLKGQPIYYKNLVLVFNGEIYNLDEVKHFLKYKDEIDSFEILVRIIDHFLYKNNGHLLEAIKKTINIIDGDYAFAVFDGKNLAICRDNMGVKPLYYGKREDSSSNDNSFKGFASEEVEGNVFNGFASEKKALWKIGINNDDIKTLKPGYILYNWREIAPTSVPWKLNLEYKLKIATMDHIKVKNSLKNLIINSTYKRVANLDEIGLIFSGGVDSTILAVLLKNLSDKTNLKLNLYSVGNENSQDLQFSEKIADELDLHLKTQIINEKVVKNSLKPILNAIEEFNVMKIGVGMVLYLATKLAKKDGINVVVSGQGADELFVGYNRYLSIYDKGGNLAIDQSLAHDIENCYHVNLQRDDAVAMANGVELRIPFLDKKLVEFSLAIPSKYKIYSSTDKLRKHILRDVAIDLGVPEYVAFREKKAAQYGSGIDKILRKKILKDFDSEKFMEDLINTYLFK